jgi:decaprenyl-phosphate phosphoribosyltransferase
VVVELKIKSFFKAAVLLIKSRKEALGLWLWCSIVASLLVGRGFPPLQPSLMSIASTVFIAIAVYVYNDVVDMDADRHNAFKNDRPLALGEVSRGDAMKLIYISSIVGLTISFLNNFMSFLFSALYFFVFYLYSYPKIHLKKRFLVKESVISSGLIMVGLSVNYAILGSFSPMVFVGFLLFAVFAFFAMPTGFDSTDVEADKLQGVKSIASMLNYRQRMQLAITGMLLVMTATPLTYITFGFNILLPVSIILTGIVFLWLMFPLMMSVNPVVDSVDISVLLKTRKIIVIFIFVICGCVILGSLNLNIFYI